MPCCISPSEQQHIEVYYLLWRYQRASRGYGSMSRTFAGAQRVTYLIFREGGWQMSSSSWMSDSYKGILAVVFLRLLHVQTVVLCLLEKIRLGVIFSVEMKGRIAKMGQKSLAWTLHARRPAGHSFPTKLLEVGPRTNHS